MSLLDCLANICLSNCYVYVCIVCSVHGVQNVLLSETYVCITYVFVGDLCVFSSRFSELHYHFLTQNKDNIKKKYLNENGFSKAKTNDE